MINRKNMKPTITICLAILLTACNTQKKQETDNNSDSLTYIIHSGFISGYQNRYGDNLKPPTNVYHRMTA